MGNLGTTFFISYLKFFSKKKHFKFGKIFRKRHSIIYCKIVPEKYATYMFLNIIKVYLSTCIRSIRIKLIIQFKLKMMNLNER